MNYGELGWFPIDIYIKIRMVSFWARLLLGKETKLSYLSYKLLFTLSIEDNVHFVWIKLIKELFNETGYSSIWNNQDIPNSNGLISSIKLRFHDQFKQDWYSQIEHSLKALNYRIFKEKFEFGNYIRILEEKDIYILCKFRTTNHISPIETGRWNNIDRVNRICTKCDNIAIGDE